jgi:hypothetical protein
MNDNSADQLNAQELLRVQHPGEIGDHRPIGTTGGGEIGDHRPIGTTGGGEIGDHNPMGTGGAPYRP